MAKQRKENTTKTPSSTSADEIPESEQWRIIEQTGLLKKIPQSKPATRNQKQAHDQGKDEDPFSPLCNEIFNAICFSIPMSSLYIMMNVLAHRQYAQELTVRGILDKFLWGIPSLFLLIFYSLRYKTDRRAQALMFLLSVASGCRLIYIVNWSSWRTVVNQSPPLGTVWVYTIVYLNLLPGVAALAIVGAYVKWKDLKIIF